MKTNIRRTINRMGKFLSKPKVSIVVGFLLLFAGVCEIMETTLLGFEVDAAHGMMIFAASHIVISLTHILEGVEDFAIVAEVAEVEAVEAEKPQENRVRG